MARAKDSFTGRSGQLAVMAEFLIRQMNVAIPEVDVGDDIIVVREENDEITRVQVKTANAQERRRAGTFYAQFSVPFGQLEKGPPKLVYAFVVRRSRRWEEFVIVRRSVLYQLHTDHGALSGKGDNRILGLAFAADNALHKDLSFQVFRSRFEPWPPADEIPEGVVGRTSDIPLTGP
jgi:hypothetical protein